MSLWHGHQKNWAMANAKVECGISYVNDHEGSMNRM